MASAPQMRCSTCRVGAGPPGAYNIAGEGVVTGSHLDSVPDGGASTTLQQVLGAGRSVPGDLLVASYRRLWDELTEPLLFPRAEPWRLDRRVRRLQELGFELAEYSLRAADAPGMMIARPVEIHAGYHRRRLTRLTGLEVQENQARRLLVDIEAARREWDPYMDIEAAAHRWVVEVFDPVVRSVPLELRAKLEPAEVMHQLLEHRWYLSEARGQAVPLQEVVDSYVDTVLRARRDEDAVALHPTTTMLRAVPPAPDRLSPICQRTVSPAALAVTVSPGARVRVVTRRGAVQTS